MSKISTDSKKKMLAILASPRKNGNVAKMLNLAMKEAEKQGYDVKLVNLYEKNIAYCKGCMACKKTGVCVIDDDISAIRQSLISCDLAVIACPTYFANVTAPLKNMFDRLVATLMDDNGGMIPKPKLSKKQKYILLTTCSTPSPFDLLGGQSNGCLKAMNEALHISGMTCAGKVVFAGTKEKSELPQSVQNKIARCLK